MKRVIKIEELFYFLFSLFLFNSLGFAWWWFVLLILTPDLSMLGYLFGSTLGAYTYNFVHHKGLGIILYVLGAMLGNAVLQLAGVITFGHSSIDRVFGYGLKHVDSFQHTHLGWIGDPS